LPELLGGVKGEPLQVELRAVRILFELLGFLLSVGFYQRESPESTVLPEKRRISHAAGRLHFQNLQVPPAASATSLTACAICVYNVLGIIS
jgi:hypothetical protein